MDFEKLLNNEKKKYLVKTGGGVGLPIAGCIYWLVLAIAGIYLGVKNWSLLAFYTSGLIFPLGLLLSKATKGDLLSKTALTNLFLPAFISMFLFFPSAITAFSLAPELVPLILAIGMSVHWPIIGWAYGSAPLFISHAVIRAVVVTAIWVLLPEHRITLLPLSVALVYLGTIPFLLSAVKKADKFVKMGGGL